VAEALAGLDRASAALRPARDDAVVRLSVLPSFASHWLVPRLPAFEAESPGIEVRLEATTRYADLERDPIDAAIRFGTGPWPGLRADRLAPLTFFPVCSPRLCAGATPLRAVPDLAGHTWLEEAHVPGTWKRWLQAAGHADVSPARMLVYDHAQLLLDAAIAGQGVGIMTDILAARALATGELVAPFALRAPTDLAYHLVTPDGRSLSPALTRFREWILDASRAWAGERDEALAQRA
jgi:LysR family glycine cleavage system transcriptional activator